MSPVLVRLKTTKNPPSNVRVHIKCFPEMVQAVRTRSSSDIKQDANIGLEHRPKRVEEPSVRVDLLLVMFFHEENDLSGNDSLVGITEM